MTVEQELTLIATALSFGMLAMAVLGVLAIMGALWLGMWLVERRERTQVTIEYGGSRYGRSTF